MARQYGEEFPERALMGVISDLLGIPHFTTAHGGTVRKDFLLATARGLGVSDATLQGLKKDEVLALVVEAATKRPMDIDYFSPEGNVKNSTLKVIVDGINEHGVQARPEVPKNVESTELGAEGDLDFEALGDERTRRLMEVVAREGQDKFRQALIDAYSQRCAVTESDATESLDAAHIFPYTGPKANHVTNGLLLRADIHRLFDRGALAIHEVTKRVILRESLSATSYASLGGKKIRLPRRAQDHPSAAALRSHREWSGL